MPIAYRKRTEYDLIEFLLETELEYLKKYIDDQFANLKKHEDNIKSLVYDTIWIERTEPLPILGVELLVHSSSFSYQSFYKSALITLYSFFENLLKEISRIARSLAKTDIKLKGQPGILAYKDYLTKVIGLNFKELDPLWKQIDDIRVVRNYFIHDYLENPDEEHLKEIICVSDKNIYLAFDKENNELTILDRQYLLTFCSLLKEFTLGLIKK